jgi:hypothetical protein
MSLSIDECEGVTEFWLVFVCFSQRKGLIWALLYDVRERSLLLFLSLKQ